MQPSASDADVDDAAFSAARLRCAEAEPGSRSSATITVRGRLTARRRHGASLIFLDIAPVRDGAAEPLQLVVECDANANAARATDGAPTAAKLPLGSSLCVTGAPGRTVRGVPSLFLAAEHIEVLGPPPADAAGPSAPRVRVPLDVRERVLSRCPARFHLVPSTVRWQRTLANADPSLRNTLDWRGGEPLPVAPTGGRRCWLLPTTDSAALAIARQQAELRAAGWNLLTSDEATVGTLSNKALFADHAAALGLSSHLPGRYAHVNDATYPCVLKAADGQFGKQVALTHNSSHNERVHS